MNPLVNVWVTKFVMIYLLLKLQGTHCFLYLMRNHMVLPILTSNPICLLLLIVIMSLLDVMDSDKLGIVLVFTSFHNSLIFHVALEVLYERLVHIWEAREKDLVGYFSDSGFAWRIDVLSMPFLCFNYIKLHITSCDSLRNLSSCAQRNLRGFGVGDEWNLIHFVHVHFVNVMISTLFILSSRFSESQLIIILTATIDSILEIPNDHWSLLAVSSKNWLMMHHLIEVIIVTTPLKMWLLLPATNIKLLCLRLFRHGSWTALLFLLLVAFVHLLDILYL